MKNCVIRFFFLKTEFTNNIFMGNNFFFFLWEPMNLMKVVMRLNRFESLKFLGRWCYIVQLKLWKVRTVTWCIKINEIRREFLERSFARFSGSLPCDERDKRTRGEQVPENLPSPSAIPRIFIFPRSLSFDLSRPALSFFSLISPPGSSLETA